MGLLDILLPFSLPPQELARDLLRALDAPALATLLGKSRLEPAAANRPEEGFFRSLPHERWLAEAIGLPGNAAQSSPPVASCLVSEHAEPAPEGWWFLLQPAHLHVAMDHLVLTDLRTLHLSDHESRRLFDTARPLFEDSGFTLRYADALHWLLRADAWRDLHTATPDSACGRNIDIWMPQGDAARAWRRLHNEVQMTWFAELADSLQTDRESRGLKPVNALWIWGGGAASADSPAEAYDVVYNLGGAFGCAARHRSLQDGEELRAGLTAQNGERFLLVADQLLPPALAGDWGTWIAALQDIEARWLAPSLVLLREGRLDTIRLILTDGSTLRTRRCSRNGLRKFWKKPSLTVLTE